MKLISALFIKHIAWFCSVKMFLLRTNFVQCNRRLYGCRPRWFEENVSEDLDDKATVDEMKDMQAMINEIGRSPAQTLNHQWRKTRVRHQECSHGTGKQDPVWGKNQANDPGGNRSHYTSPNTNTRGMVDINNRRNNAIIYRLPEQNESAYKSQGEQRNQKDMAEAYKIAATVLENPPSDCITKCTRLGKSTTDTVRPLLTTFRDTNLEDSFMSSLKNLRGTSYHDISIAHDLTKNQRDELQKLKTEAYAKQQQDSGDWVYRVVGYPLMCSIKTLKKGSPSQPAEQSSYQLAQNGTPAALETMPMTGPPVEPELPQVKKKRIHRHQPSQQCAPQGANRGGEQQCTYSCKLS